jgi:serine/threonine protein kinase
VKLIGHLEADNERILVTEFVPNGNLRQHLDGDLGVTLDMSKRLDIAIDVAHALAYLHFYAGKKALF